MNHSYFEGTEGLIVSTEDVNRYFLRNSKSIKPKNNEPGSLINSIGNKLITIALLFVLGYALINAPALFIKSKYYVQNDLMNKSSNITKAPDVPLPTPKSVVNGAQSQPETIPNVKDNHLTIEKINLDTPIIWDSTDENNELMMNLRNGVASLKSNSKPDQKGNTFIVGHSSNYIWAKGNYKQVFALLTELKIGDKINVGYKGIAYQYKVSELKTVGPTDTTVLDNSKNQLTLMTCVPLGTNLRRYIVVATPSASNPIVEVTKSENSPAINLLPSIR